MLAIWNAKLHYNGMSIFHKSHFLLIRWTAHEVAQKASNQTLKQLVKISRFIFLVTGFL